MVFANRLRDFPLVLEVVPPHGRASDKAVRSLVKKVHEAVRTIPELDAVNLPEVLDENHAGMPFYRNMDPRRFAGLLNLEGPLEPIVNKVVVHMKGVASFDRWVKESLDAYGLRNFVLVGGGSSRVKYPGPTVAEANGRLAELTEAYADVATGNIAIPERADEVSRLVGKTRTGSRFFTTQVLFEAEPIATTLRQYGEACHYEGVHPATVLLSFAPVSDYQDVEFLAWLGATVTPETEERLLQRGVRPGIASLQVALKILTKIRDAVEGSPHAVPLGVNIEQIATHNFELAVKMAQEFLAWKDSKV